MRAAVMQMQARQCEALVEDLVRALERRDLLAMEQNVRALRACLAPMPSSTTLEIERLDALNGLAEEVESALRRMRRSAAGEMARIRAAAPLMQQVVLVQQ